MSDDLSNSAEDAIVVSGINKSFGELAVLKDFSMALKNGENLVVLGKSGSGKSVLIKCIIGLMHPDSGSIKVLGQEITTMGQTELDEMRVKVGFLFQSNALYDSMSVRENLEFPLRRHWSKTAREEIDRLVMEVLEHVGLANTIDMMPEELSGGMRKRIALARALILKPKIILYDEPTTGLDPITGKGISKLMLDVQEKYKTSSLIISHDMHCVKMIANRIVMLIDGMCYAIGTYQELSTSDDHKIKEFFE